MFWVVFTVFLGFWHTLRATQDTVHCTCSKKKSKNSKIHYNVCLTLVDISNVYLSSGYGNILTCESTESGYWVLCKLALANISFESTPEGEKAKRDSKFLRTDVVGETHSPSHSPAPPPNSPGARTAPSWSAGRERGTQWFGSRNACEHFRRLWPSFPFFRRVRPGNFVPARFNYGRRRNMKKFATKWILEYQRNWHDLPVVHFHVAGKFTSASTIQINFHMPKAVASEKNCH